MPHLAILGGGGIYIYIYIYISYLYFAEEDSCCAILVFRWSEQRKSFCFLKSDEIFVQQAVGLKNSTAVAEKLNIIIIATNIIPTTTKFDHNSDKINIIKNTNNRYIKNRTGSNSSSNKNKTLKKSGTVHSVLSCGALHPGTGLNS